MSIIKRVMITIIHGDDIASSRKFYIKERQKVRDPIIFEGKNLILSDLFQTFEGGGLFSDNKTIFIEELLSGKKDSKEFDEIVSYLVKNSGNNIWIWENKDVSKVKNELIKKAILESFNFPKEIFSFLDSIRPDNQLQISLFHKVLQTTEPEVVFAMLVRQFKLFLALKERYSGKAGLSGTTPESLIVIPAEAGIYTNRSRVEPGMTQYDEIDEVKRLAPWQISKLKRQANLFSSQQLKNIYQKLFEIDLAQKTGANNSLSLSQSIDFFLLGL